MKTLLEAEPVGDTQLVALCLRGDREAFAQIVARYQSVVCALAYSACGDVARSEDVAQETFLTAWRKLADLKEPAQLKAWLCGITRNLLHNSTRREQRAPTAVAEPLPIEMPDDTATPSDQAMSKEEAALLWRALEGIPEIYREPMVLYYREEQSTQAVAAALDISEELVRQRLSRGREMLNERITKTIEIGLRRSAPGKAFTLGVLAALPLAGTSAKAVTLGGTVLASGKAAGWFGNLPSFLSFAPAYCFYRVDIENAGNAEARRFVRQRYAAVIVGLILFIPAQLKLMTWGESLKQSDPALYVGLWVGFFVANVIYWGSLTWWTRRREMRIRSENLPPGFEYRSKFTLLGWPLVHIRVRPGWPSGRVKAWFAWGGSATGLIFAGGTWAVAPICVSLLSVGFLSVGGIAVGVASLGELSFGHWAAGYCAVGRQAYGNWAIGWAAAQGSSIAVAHEFAQGELARGRHINDAAAAAFFQDGPFFQTMHALSQWCHSLAHHGHWIYVAYLPPIILWWRMKMRKRMATRCREITQATERGVP